MTVAHRVPLGLGGNLRNMSSLGNWFRRDHGPEGTFEETSVTGSESGSGVLMEPCESIWKIMWSWDKFSGVGMVSGKSAFFDAFV